MGKRRRGLKSLITLVFFEAGLLLFPAMSVQAAGASMYLSPSTQSVITGSAVSVAIHEDSSTDTVNGVQVNLAYSTDKLAYSSTSYTTSAFDVHAGGSGGGGTVTLSLGKTPPPVSGDQIVAVVNFQ